jgi:DNA-binding NarL/FixJ family response regulator
MDEMDAPDVMVLDTALPDMRGVEAIRRARQARRGLRVLALVNRADDQTVFEVLRSGADGCLEKTVGAGGLAQAIAAIASGNRVFTPEQERTGVEELGRLARHAREASAVAAAVTPRELEILRYASQGLTMRQVASRLGVSPRTVEAHIAKVYRKLGVTNRVRAIGRATELGLIELGP